MAAVYWTLAFHGCACWCLRLQVIHGPAFFIFPFSVFYFCMFVLLHCGQTVCRNLFIDRRARLTTFVIKFDEVFDAICFFPAAGLKPTTHMRMACGAPGFYLISCGNPTTHMRIAFATVGPDLIRFEKNKLPCFGIQILCPKVSSGSNSSHYP